MSIYPVDYINCGRCGYHLIGRTERITFLANIGNIAVFEVEITWICLRCVRIQREETRIRETRLD